MNRPKLGEMVGSKIIPQKIPTTKLNVQFKPIEQIMLGSSDILTSNSKQFNHSRGGDTKKKFYAILGYLPS